ncbi:MAG TPA: sigma-70 family RNA polymerase sigma factor [Streptosporangiaceae bacterium]|jgi:RNA polymerase sigma-70 factor (ECF subfamily)
MSEHDWLAEQFERYRPQLTAVSYRMLGSHAEADDAVQDSWIRVSRSGAAGVDNLGGWLTTIVARVCLNMLRSRNVRREDPAGFRLPDPVVSLDDGPGPEQEALLADSVGLALQVVLDTLAPAERLAFVLHDMFDLPYEDIAPMVGRTPVAARQLASRARRRVQGADVRAPDPDLGAQRAVVSAFFAAARGGDFDGLVAVLDPGVVLRSDGGAQRAGATQVLRGAAAVAGRAVLFSQPGAVVWPALVNGAAGVVVTVAGRPVSVMGFTVANGKIAEILSLVDPDRLARLDLSAITGEPAP